VEPDEVTLERRSVDIVILRTPKGCAGELGMTCDTAGNGERVVRFVPDTSAIRKLVTVTGNDLT
jgi:hypothetical protein